MPHNLPRPVGGYYGQHEFTLDDKGRVSLPSVFRKEAEDSSFVLSHSREDFLSLYPESEWATLLTDMRTLRKQGPDQSTWVRGLMANAVAVTTDKQGRILIPARMQALAQLTGPVLLLGNINRIELWNPELFRRRQEELDHGAFAAYAHQLFDQ